MVKIHQPEKRNFLSTTKTLSSEQMVDTVVKVLTEDNRVMFAYLCGSMVYEGKANNIDVAVSPESQEDCYSLAVDLKIDLHKADGQADGHF